MFEQAGLLQLVNELRMEVSDWRIRGYPGVTNTTSALLRHWNSDQPEPRLFFAQKEAVETIIYLHEAAPGKHWAWRRLKDANLEYNSGMNRLAVKMATGAGKTAVMAMVIAWQSANHAMHPGDARFTNQFAVITPGITVKERNIRDLIPQPNGDDLYRRWRLLPNNDRNLAGAIQGARVSVTNYQTLQLREMAWGNANGKAKRIGRIAMCQETHADMLKRALPALDESAPILALNDEGHHCHNTDPLKVATDTEEKKAADLWFNGIRAIRDTRRLHSIIDFSATPVFMTLHEGAKGRAEIFPWTISDFPITDAIEAGMVKIPRVPVADQSQEDDGPIYRNLYVHSKGKTKQSPEQLTEPLHGALHSLYEKYGETWQAWKTQGAEAPPVLIVVANNVANATAIFDYVSGYEPDVGSHWQPGQLPLLSNVDPNTGLPLAQPRAILIHSKLDNEEEKIAGKMSGYLKWQSSAYRRAFPERTTGMSDNAVLREVMNTVGKKGEMGEQVHCVVSVAMLTEGWDTRTVTHVLGFRAFGTQLLCEQVAGRSLRRVNYDNFDETAQRFPEEYSDILGIPFTFAYDHHGDSQPPPRPSYEVQSLPERGQYAIVWPVLTGYRMEPASYDRLNIDWPAFGQYQAQPVSLGPVEISGIAGTPAVIQSLRERDHTAVFRVAADLTDRLVEQGGADDGILLRRTSLFPEAVLRIREGIANKRISGAADAISDIGQEPNLSDLAQRLAENAKLGATQQKPRITGIGGALPFSSTRDIQPYWSSRPDKLATVKSQLNIAPCDNGWELRVARALDRHPKVIAWARNDRQRWQVPYLYQGSWHHYEPDFVARIQQDGAGQPLNLVIEVKGQERDPDREKRRYIEEYWLPAVNGDATWRQHGLWEYLYIDEPDTADTDISRVATGPPIQPDILPGRQPR